MTSACNYPDKYTIFWQADQRNHRMTMGDGPSARRWNAANSYKKCCFIYSSQRCLSMIF